MSANLTSSLAQRGAPSAIAQNANPSADYTLHVREAITVLHAAAALGAQVTVAPQYLRSEPHAARGLFKLAEQG